MLFDITLIANCFNRYYETASVTGMYDKAL